VVLENEKKKQYPNKFLISVLDFSVSIQKIKKKIRNEKKNLEHLNEDSNFYQQTN